MNESDKTYGKCPKCKGNTYFTGIWADDNPTLSNGKKACVECKVEDIYSEFFNRRSKKVEPTLQK